MIIQNLKNKLKDKFTKKFIIIFLLFLLLIFFLLKNEFIYNVINYIQNYLNYYIDKYLNGIVADLAYNSQSLIYVENDVKNVASSLFLYVITFGQNLYFIIVIGIILIIFNKVSNEYYSEIYQNGIVNKITRINMKKYLNTNILINSIYYGLIFIIPKILYLLILSFFFPVGVSHTHFIDYASYLSQAFLYNAYALNPYIMIFLDLVLTFLFGIIIYYISLIIVSSIKNKLMSYFIFIVVIIMLSIITTLLPTFLFNKVAFIFYNSIFVYFSQTLKYEINVNNIYTPIYILFILTVLIGVIAKISLKNGIKRNL